MELFKILNIGEPNEKTINYGHMTWEDILLVTRGYKYDEETGVFTRKGSKHGFYII